MYIKKYIPPHSNLIHSSRVKLNPQRVFSPPVFSFPFLLSIFSPSSQLVSTFSLAILTASRLFLCYSSYLFHSIEQDGPF